MLLAGALTGVIAFAACRDLPTSPQLSPDGGAMRSTAPFDADPSFGSLNSPNSGSWDGGAPSGWDGSVERKLIGVFPLPTIITVRTSGTVCQVPGILHGYDLCWGPQGTSDHQEAIALWVDHPNQGSGIWFTTGTEPQTFSIRDVAYALRVGLNDPQPWGEYYWTCGRYVGVACWGYAGDSHLDFVRVPVAMTLTSSTPGPVARGTVVSFTAGRDSSTVAGRAVDFSMLQWRWISSSGTDTVTCTSASGSSCSRPILASGTMYASAYVNGEHQQQSVHIELQPAPDSANKLKLAGTPGRVPAGGGPVTFTAFPLRATTSWGVTGWLFLPDSGAPRSSTACPRESTLKSCVDSITQTGTMRVYGYVPTVPNDSADFRVYAGADGQLKVSGPATYNPAGDPVTFTASAPAATSFAVTSWAFHLVTAPGTDGRAPVNVGARMTAEPAAAVPCGTGETCTIMPNGAGYAVAVAMVDGEEQTDSAYTAPEPNHITVSASELSVPAGTPVRFTAATEHLPANLVVTGWRFEGDNGQVSVGPGCTDPSSATVCEEVLDRSGTMKVFGTVNGKSQSASVHVEVKVALVIRFDAHAGIVTPSIYPFGPGSACSARMVTAPKHTWGLTVLDGTGPGAKVVKGAALELALGADEESGHHLAHSGIRPVGSFTSGSDHVTRTTVTTDDDGHVRFDYFPGEFSGLHFVRAELRGIAQADSFWVGYPLGELQGAFRDWQPYGGGRDKHRDVYFASPNMQAAALALAKAYTTKFPGKYLYFNDMGLPTGGRFDVLGTWDQSVDHCSHRFGNALDLHTNDLTTKEFNWVSAKWKLLTGLKAPLFHRGHYHLQTTRQF